MDFKGETIDSINEVNSENNELYFGSKDWRSDEEPQPVNKDSFFANQVPVKKEIVIEFAQLSQNKTLRTNYNLSSHSRRITNRKIGSSKSIRNNLRRSLDKARAHLDVSSKFGKQKVLDDLPPEEIEDIDVHRMRAIKQRESVRKEKDLRDKKEIRRLNKERTKQNKADSKKLSKMNYTYDYQGSIMFVGKPNIETLPGDYNQSKISKKSMKKAIIPVKNLNETVDQLLIKHFVKKNDSLLNTKQSKLIGKAEGKKNYKGMENR